jgi:hypothetical protein
MGKYRQKVIPSASTAEWRTLNIAMLHKKMYAEYRSRYDGKNVVNQHLGITIGFETGSAKKTALGSAAYSKKACLVSVLDQLLCYAEYNNWGDRKAKDPANVIGFFNFKAKVRIDGKLEHVHLVVRVRKDGKFHYAMEVNKKPQKT